MTLSDPRKFRIFMEMTDPYNLDDYINRCNAVELSVRGSEMEWAQKVGMALFAIRKYPDMTPFEAYMTFVSGGGQVQYGEPGQRGDCTGCGGGKIK